MSKPLIVTLAILLGPAAALSAGAQPADEEGARRAELQRLLVGVEARMAAIPSQRACAPRVGLEDHAAMFEADIARSPLSAEEAARIARGIVQLDDFVRYYETSVADVCRVYDQVRATESRFERLRIDVHEPLLRAVTSIQSRLPSSASELKEVFQAQNCYYPSRHAAVVSSCLYEGTPFGALREFVHVADDGVIRARHDARLGRDHVTRYHRYTGGSFLYRNHTKVDVVNTVRSDGGSFKFGVKATRKALHSRTSTLRWAKDSLRYSLGLPSSATIADIYVARLVDAARRHAAGWCERTVKSGALLARTFNVHAPSGGEAARRYADAAKMIRADIERIAATGAADLCTGRNADLRALIGPALDEAVEPPVDIDEALYVEARTKEELMLRSHGRYLRAGYLLGETAARLIATDAGQ